MTDISELHAQALDATGRIVRGVAADRWHTATPCAGWDRRAPWSTSWLPATCGPPNWRPAARSGASAAGSTVTCSVMTLLRRTANGRPRQRCSAVPERSVRRARSHTGLCPVRSTPGTASSTSWSILTRNPNTDGRAALVTWGFLEALSDQSAEPVEVLLVAQRRPVDVCPGHAHQRCPLGVLASTGLPHRESRLGAVPTGQPHCAGAVHSGGARTSSGVRRDHVPCTGAAGGPRMLPAQDRGTRVTGSLRHPGSRTAAQVAAVGVTSRGLRCPARRPRPGPHEWSRTGQEPAGCFWRLPADRPVGEFTNQVGVPVVARVLRAHVDVDPPQRAGFTPPGEASVVENAAAAAFRLAAHSACHAARSASHSAPSRGTISLSSMAGSYQR